MSIENKALEIEHNNLPNNRAENAKDFLVRFIENAGSKLEKDAELIIKEAL